MTDTPTKPAAAPTSAQLFGELLKELKKHPADVEQRVVAHIRETTQHATLPSYHNNGASEQDKLKMYAFLLLAVRQDLSRLKGTVASGQATKPAEAKPEPAAKAESPKPASTETKTNAPAAKIEPASATPPDDATLKIATMLKAMMGGQQQTVTVDEAKVREIVNAVVGDQLMAIRKDAQDKIAAYLSKIPPRDCIEIRKWDGTVTEVKGAYHRQLPDIIQTLTSVNAIGWSEFVYIHGAPGAGKTHMLRQIAQALNVPHYPFPCGPTTTEGKLLGFNNIANGTFVPGWLYKPYKEGGLVGLDEVDLADASVLAGANSIENDEFTFGNGETVKRHKNFHLIAFANTIGTGATGGFIRNKLDAATLNRFTHIKLEYDPELEAKIFGNPKWAAYVVKVREYVAKNCNNSLYITPRATRKGAAYLANGIPPEKVADRVLFGLCSEEVKQSILKNVGPFKA